jgi:hypothetical protein
MKWILVFLNVAAILVLIGLRQYAHGYHRMEAEDAYQGLISRGLLDEKKVEEYARLHNGWHPRERLASIGSPDGFVQNIFVVGVAACAINAVAVLMMLHRRRLKGAEPGGAANRSQPVGSEANRTSPAAGSGG